MIGNIASCSTESIPESDASLRTTMIPEFHSARGYLAFDSVIKSIEQWLEHKAPSVCSYRSGVISKRLVQRVVEISLPSFMREGARRYASGIRTLPSQDREMRCAGLVVNSTTGRIGPGLGMFGRSVAEFILYWAHALFVHLRSALRLKKAQAGPAVVVFGVGAGDLQAGGSDARFIEYCRRGPVGPLAKARRLVIQAVGLPASSEPRTVSYSRFPLHTLVLENPLGLRDLAGFLYDHIRVFVSYFVSVVRLPVVAVLGRDFAYHAMVSRLNDRGLIEAVVITNSNHPAQPLWMNDLPGRRFASHMVWYSNNNALPVYKADPIVAYRPNFRHIQVDEIWTWTDWHARQLQEIGVTATMHVVGPILWYPPQAATTDRVDSDIRIAVFDVTPVTPDEAERLGLINNYYCAENMTWFIKDILYACAELERLAGRRVRILLKHKRSHKPTHDSGYISLIDRLAGEDQTIELVAPDSNIYSLISGSDLSVIIPYSSPAYVATILGCSAIYYDPTNEVQPVYDEQPLLSFVAGRDNLVTTMRRVLDSNVAREAVCRR